MTTRDRIVQLGRDFIQQLGYHSFKYQLVSKELNIKNAAVHHYFPAKEDLGVAVIEKDKTDFLQMTETLKDKPARDKVEGLLGLYNYYNDTGKNLCVIGACISAFTELPQRMGAAALKYQDAIYGWLIEAFGEGLKNGEFQFPEPPEALASLWIAALPGALQGAKARGADYFHSVVEQLRRSLNQRD